LAVGTGAEPPVRGGLLGVIVGHRHVAQTLYSSTRIIWTNSHIARHRISGRYIYMVIIWQALLSDHWILRRRCDRRHRRRMTANLHCRSSVTPALTSGWLVLTIVMWCRIGHCRHRRVMRIRSRHVFRDDAGVDRCCRHRQRLARAGESQASRRKLGRLNGGELVLSDGTIGERPRTIALA